MNKEVPSLASYQLPCLFSDIQDRTVAIRQESKQNKIVKTFVCANELLFLFQFKKKKKKVNLTLKTFTTAFIKLGRLIDKYVSLVFDMKKLEA